MTPLARPRRSAIYLPASVARAVDKARVLPCDVVILDLEDMVGPDAKTEARAAALAAVRAGGFGHCEVVIRVNGLDSPWGAADLAAAAQAKPDAVLVPKISRPQDLAAARDALGAGAPLWAMIETCAAIIRLDEIGAASQDAGVSAWVIGSNDLAKDMHCPLTAQRQSLLPALAMSVMAARAHGLAILDGIFNDLSDGDGLAAQCAQAAAFGFDGKTLIHPTQIEAANQAFTPIPDALAWARVVVAAFEAPENAGQGLLRVEGRLVERLHAAEAKRLLAMAKAIAEAEDG
jgi:citrate lyase subunit beta/citryl-CoA lyase